MGQKVLFSCSRVVQVMHPLWSPVNDQARKLEHKWILTAGTIVSISIFGIHLDNQTKTVENVLANRLSANRSNPKRRRVKKHNFVGPWYRAHLVTGRHNCNDYLSIYGSWWWLFSRNRGILGFGFWFATCPVLLEAYFFSEDSFGFEYIKTS